MNELSFKQRDMLSPNQLAAIIGWHEESVRRAIRQGRIPAVKMGRNWRIQLETAEMIRQNGIPLLKS